MAKRSGQLSGTKISSTPLLVRLCISVYLERLPEAAMKI